MTARRRLECVELRLNPDVAVTREHLVAYMAHDLQDGLVAKAGLCKLRYERVRVSPEYFHQTPITASAGYRYHQISLRSPCAQVLK